MNGLRGDGGGGLGCFAAGGGANSSEIGEVEEMGGFVPADKG